MEESVDGVVSGQAVNGLAVGFGEKPFKDGGRLHVDQKFLQNVRIHFALLTRPFETGGVIAIPQCTGG